LRQSTARLAQHRFEPSAGTHIVVRAKELEAQDVAAAQARAVAFADRIVQVLKPLGANTREELASIRAEIAAAALKPDRDAIARRAIDDASGALDFLATKTDDGYPAIETDLPLEDRPCFFQADVLVEGRALHGRGRVYALGDRVVFVGDDLRRVEWPLSVMRHVDVNGGRMTLQIKNRQTPIVVNFATTLAAFCLVQIISWRATAMGGMARGEVYGQTLPSQPPVI
jgi:hypothetical protein